MGSLRILEGEREVNELLEETAAVAAGKLDCEMRLLTVFVWRGIVGGSGVDNVA